MSRTTKPWDGLAATVHMRTTFERVATAVPAHVGRDPGVQAKRRAVDAAYRDGNYSALLTTLVDWEAAALAAAETHPW